MSKMILGEEKSREEVMREIRKNPVVYSKFLDLKQVFQEQFVQFCMGVRGMKMTYDTFFKHVFDAEVHPERLSKMLTQIIGRPLVVKRMLPTEHRLISDKGSLLFLDIIVEFENGELADVEIQKVGFYFPGQRASCYAADMVMRQYERQRSLRGDDFTYQDMKKVYTIVIVEKHSKEMKAIENEYLHRGKWKFDTGLNLELLEEFFFISLENFFKIEDNKEDTKGLSELEAWMYFIGSDKPEHIRKVIENFPWFAELYEDVAYFRHHPEEAIGMFSEALRKLDENTINFMIDDMRGELEGLKRELANWQKALDDKKQELANRDKELADRDKELADRDKELADRDKELADRDKELADRDKELANKEQKLLEQEQEILELKKLLAEKKTT